MRLSVHMQREIVRLHFHDPSRSSRSIAGAIGISTNTVCSLRELLSNAALDEAALQELDDDGWTNALGTHDRSIAVRKPAPDWDWVHQEMQRSDATLEALWREWRETCPNGIAYTQFSTSYRAWKKAQHIVMRRTHAPGEKLFVDFAGQTVEVRDPSGGPSTFAQIFVAALGYSNFTYVEAVASQTTPDWIQCHINCFNALGGAPKWVVCDNLKAGVLRRERDRIVINPAYQDALRHFGTAIAPARPRKPKDKPKAEVAVQIVQRWVLFRLRDRVFFSLAELQNEIAQLVDWLNKHPFKTMQGSRQQWFEDQEQALLRPLPELPYEICDWRYDIKVGADHHVAHEGNFYSVPFQLAHLRVDIRTTRSLVQMFRRGRRVAMHERRGGSDQSFTQAEHRPLGHVRVLEGEPKALLQWAESVGSNAHLMMRYHLEERADGANGLRTAKSLRDLARAYGDARFEAVCTYALRLKIRTLRALKSIFSEALDQRSLAAPPATARPKHSNLRGADYYKN